MVYHCGSVVDTEENYYITMHLELFCILLQASNDLFWTSRFSSTWNTFTMLLFRNCSDVLRVVLMYKYGGTYLDTDIITLQQHPDVSDTPNFVVFEEPGSINGAMLRLRPKHPLLQTIGQQMGKYFSVSVTTTSTLCIFQAHLSLLVSGRQLGPNCLQTHWLPTVTLQISQNDSL